MSERERWGLNIAYVGKTVIPSAFLSDVTTGSMVAYVDSDLA
jgi:hypothetical protein